MKARTLVLIAGLLLAIGLSTFASSASPTGGHASSASAAGNHESTAPHAGSDDAAKGGTAATHTTINPTRARDLSAGPTSTDGEASTTLPHPSPTTTTSLAAPPATRSAIAQPPPPSTVPTTTVPPASAGTGTKIGISLADTLIMETPSQIAAELSQIRSIGVTWIRVDLEWSGVQPTSASSYSWNRFDAIVAAANAEGISVMPILDYTPPWARPAGCGTEFCAPADPSAFGAFAGAAAARYAPMGVHYWEIWNEPNNTQFWQPQPNAANYVTLLRAASSAIRLADPHAFVISGGLAPEATSGGNIAQLTYLSSFCADGGPAYVDAIGYHPYSYPVLPSDAQPWNAWTQIDGTSTSVRSILNGCGAASKKIWLTEYGAPTNGPGAEATISNYNFSANPDHVSESLQALMATQSVQLARADPNVGALFWYTYEDSSTDTSSAHNFFGLLNSDGTPKPAWSALQAAIAG